MTNIRSKKYNKMISEEWYTTFLKIQAIYQNQGNLDNLSITLDNWLKEQRALRYRNLLSNKKIEYLDSIGMIWNLQEYRWEEMYNLACVYYKTYHNLAIPIDFITSNGVDLDIKKGKNLGSWISKQRSFKDNLTSDRIVKLDKINMIWDINEYKWFAMFKLAQNYAKCYGNLNTKTHFRTFDGVNEDENGYELDSWVRRQKVLYNKGLLSKDKILLLESLGIIWNVRKSQDKKKEICELKHIDIKINEHIIERIPYKEFMAKINYLEEQGLPIIDEQGSK